MEQAEPRTKAPKEQAQEVLEKMPSSASWDDIMYEMYVRQKVEAGLKDIAEGRVYTHEEVMRRLLGE